MNTNSFDVKNENYRYLTCDDSFDGEEDKYYVVYQYQDGGEISCGDVRLSLAQDAYLEIANQSFRFTTNGRAVILEVPSRLTAPLINASHRQNAYTVSKPWGYESWLTGLHPINDIVLKAIFIKAGTKTSLQVHELKHETNFILSGVADIVRSEEAFDGKRDYPLLTQTVDAPYVMDVAPLSIHQLSACSDLQLIEASTNHLEDVIRLRDDSGRGDGTIPEEHGL
jgi:mannose-6-phosphate isomerase